VAYVSLPSCSVSMRHAPKAFTRSYTHLCKPLKILGVLQSSHLNDFKDLRHLCIKVRAFMRGSVVISR
jgi:hypothetical protein